MSATETTTVAGETSPSPRIKIRMLIQMASVLEDQAAALYRRAAGYEEDEFLLVREIEDHQTEINRLAHKLEALRADRDGVMDKIESISNEATLLREEAYKDEEEAALASIERSTGEPLDEDDPGLHGDCEPNFFRRMDLSSQLAGS